MSEMEEFSESLFLDGEYRSGNWENVSAEEHFEFSLTGKPLEGVTRVINFKKEGLWYYTYQRWVPDGKKRHETAYDMFGLQDWVKEAYGIE